MEVTKKKRPRFKNEAEYWTFKQGISRRSHARSFNANFANGDLYATLTFSDEWEVHTFAEAKAIRKSYVRALKWKYQDAVIFLYMGRETATGRIHFHAVSHGIPKSVLIAKWKYGEVTECRTLSRGGLKRLQNTLFDHWTPEQGGHHWFQTKNTKRPYQASHVAGRHKKSVRK